MFRDKANLNDVGLDNEGTIRGALLYELAPDDPLQWPEFAPFQQLEYGRDFQLVETGANTLTIRGLQSLLSSGDLRFAFAEDDVIEVLGAGGANGSYTVVSTAMTTVTILGSPVNATEITVAEAVPASTLDDDSRVTTPTVRWPDWITFDIQSLATTGANGAVTITDPTGSLPVDCPHSAEFMFLNHHPVQITGSAGGVNDKVMRCRTDFTEAGGVYTIYLDGYINNIASGSLGSITALQPPPLRQCSGRYRLAVNRWYRATLQARSLVQCRLIDQRGDFAEICGADIGSSVPVAPE